jgi:hypothetical protein
MYLQTLLSLCNIFLDTANEYQQQSYEAEEIQLQSDDLPSEHITDTKDRSGMSVAEMVQGGYYIVQLDIFHIF